MLPTALRSGLNGPLSAVLLLLLAAFSACSSGTTESELRAIREDVREERERAQSLESQLGREKDKVAALQARLDQAEVQMAELESERARADSMESRLTDERSVVATLQARLDQMEAQIVELEGERRRASSLESELAQLREMVDEADARQALLEVLLAWNRKDTEGFAAGFTDDGLAGTLMRLPSSFGEPAIALRRLIDTTVSGDAASIHAMYALGTQRNSIDIFMVKERGAWKIEGDRQVSPKIRDGTITVDIQLDECRFELDSNAVTGGNVAFRVRNVGQQHHELILSKVLEDLNLTQLVQGVGSPQDGIRSIAFVDGLAPEDEINVAFTEPLVSGRYVFHCPVPEDPEGVLLLTKEMLGEFVVP